MKYKIGDIVSLNNGETVYITGYNENTKKYSGILMENSSPQETIEFLESKVVLRI